MGLLGDGLVLLANDNNDGANENDGIVLGDDDDAGDRLMDGIDDGAVMNGIVNIVISAKENIGDDDKDGGIDG